MPIVKNFFRKILHDPVGYGFMLMMGFFVGVVIHYQGDEQPIHTYAYYLPDAVVGQPYQVDVKIAGVWRDWWLDAQSNRYLDIEQLSPSHIRLSHSGQFHDDEKAYGITMVGGGGAGGGSSYVRHEYSFHVWVRDDDKDVINDCVTVVDTQSPNAVYYDGNAKRPCSPMHFDEP